MVFCNGIRANMMLVSIMVLKDVVSAGLGILDPYIYHY
jgi:hypothetical protein